jgi:hypothetical protein
MLRLFSIYVFLYYFHDICKLKFPCLMRYDRYTEKDV